ncbi:MAG: dienelactone hydrolase family protein [Candidatus Hydrogenedentes bacterium]|nr:dienelactone hydrolase family protein [Candidatus Hydrogenedentota bacterium]
MRCTQSTAEETAVNITTSRRGFLKSVSGSLALLATAGTPALAQPGEVDWLKEVQRPPASPEKETAHGFEPLLRADDGKPITTVTQWEQQRAEIRRRWMEFLGPMPDRPPVKLVTLSEDHPEDCCRLLVRYEAEAGEQVEGYLLHPEPLLPAPRPALVVLHSTTPDTIDEVAGIKGRDSRALGLKFAQQGFIVFCPKCFLWQDPSLDYDEAAATFRKSHPGTLGMHKMLHDAQRAVDALTSLPDVDPNRIGAVGHSLGAKETLYLMAFDERVRAGVFSEGGIGLTFTNWHDPWYLGAGIHEPGFALDHHQLLALIAPRPFLIVAGESGPPGMSVADGDRTWPYIEAALPVYRLYGEPARIGLYNHRQGHTIPDEAFERMSEWLRTYLPSRT